MEYLPFICMTARLHIPFRAWFGVLNFLDPPCPIE